MKHPVQIYFRALGLYALVTLPTIGLPIMYFISLMYAVTYGFFALAVFALAYYLITKYKPTLQTLIILLIICTPLAVVGAFQMIEVLGSESNIWNSGTFLGFPLAAVGCGWASIGIHNKHFRKIYEPEITENEFLSSFNTIENENIYS